MRSLLSFDGFDHGYVFLYGGWKNDRKMSISNSWKFIDVQVLHINLTSVCAVGALPSDC